MKITKKGKIAIIIATVIAAALIIAAVLVLNWHKIYVLIEKNGVFCDGSKLSQTSVDPLEERSLSELYTDGRVTFDQSLMLVNTEHMLSEDFTPDVLEYKDTTVYMSRCMISAYAALSEAVLRESGNKLYVSSDLRTSAEQEELYRDDPDTATVPGASEHQTGLALDVYVAYFAGDGFLKSPSGRFVNSHAHEYGFIIRYPSYGEDATGIRFEPWHIRYVGEPHASEIYNGHITLEEYIEGFEMGKWYSCEGYYISRQTLGDGDTLILPKEFESCVISPDNTGAYIVTLRQ